MKKDILRIASRCLMLLLYPYFRFVKKSQISYKAYFDFNTKLEGFNAIGENVLLRGAIVGRGTYISPLCNFSFAKIGRFCSIGRNVRIVDGWHPTRSWVSTHPAFFSTARQAGFTFVEKNKFDEHRYADKERKLSVIIGNDVWIGNNVTIMAGITIGDGAVLAAGSVVVKDVPPYSVMGGVPAKLMRFRFSESEIEKLQCVRWWDWSMEMLKKERDLFSNIGLFLEKTLEKNF